MLSTRVVKHRPAFAGVTLTALLLGNLSVWAQEAPVAPTSQSELESLRAYVSDLSKRFEEANARINELEKQQKEWTATSKKAADAAARNPAVTARAPVTISGTLAVHGLNYLSQDGPAPEAPGTFRVRRGELRLTAPRITDRVSGTVMFDVGKSVFNRSAGFGESGSNTIRARENMLQDLMLSYLLKKSRPLADGKPGSDNIFIDAGQFKVPVGYESTLLSSAQLPFIERALMFTQRDPFDGGYGDVRDVGVQLRGTRGQFDFRLGVFNGLGDRQNTLATSDAKAVLGLVSFSPKSVPGLQVGISGGRGNTGIRNTGSLLEAPRVDRNLFNAFAVYKKDKWTLQGEYSTGSGVGQNPSGALVSRDIQGYYGTVGYMITPKLEGLLRYDYLNADRDASGDTSVRDLILGLNYYLKGNTKIQANLIRRDGARDLAGASSVTNPHSDIRNDRTELRTSVQVAF